MSFARRGWFGNKRSYGGGGRGGGNRMQVMRVDPAMLVKKATYQEAEVYNSQHMFEDFAFSDQLRNNILARGYKHPTPIQDQIIPHILEGRDVVGLANTGTGKTAAFLLPMIDKILKDEKLSALVITPTRELAVQIEDELHAFAKGLKIYSTLCIGGVALGKQIMGLKKNPHFVIGTPGRLKDLRERRALNLGQYSTIVLDEVDRMLDMGFINDVRELISGLPRPRHSLFFSATMSDAARAVARELLTDPITVTVQSQKASENVSQDIVRVQGRNKVEILHELLIKPGFDKVLVFGRTKHGMERLAVTLQQKGFRATAIHGNKSQSQRQRALDDFKDNRIQILLATDVASRGLDIDNVTHVINYELPATYEDYIHRIGRTGRADKTGMALTFID